MTFIGKASLARAFRNVLAHLDLRWIGETPEGAAAIFDNSLYFWQALPGAEIFSCTKQFEVIRPLERVVQLLYCCIKTAGLSDLKPLLEALAEYYCALEELQETGFGAVFSTESYRDSRVISESKLQEETIWSSELALDEYLRCRSALSRKLLVVQKSHVVDAQDLSSPLSLCESEQAAALAKVGMIKNARALLEDQSLPLTKIRKEDICLELQADLERYIHGIIFTGESIDCRSRASFSLFFSIASISDHPLWVLQSLFAWSPGPSF